MATVPNPTTALEASTQMAAEGRLREAVELLTGAVIDTPDPVAEAELVRLRHRLHLDDDRNPPVGPWPPTMADPFPDLEGEPPEVSPDGLDADTLGGALLHHGCLLVRGLFSSEEAAGLQRRIKTAFAAIDRAFGDDPTATDPIRGDDGDPGFVEFEGGADDDLRLHRRWVRHGGGVWGVDSPRTMVEILDLYDRRGLVDAVSGYLGNRPALAVNKFTLRHVTSEALPSWHQDGAFMGTGLRSVNAWVALTPCGSDLPAPGLSLLPRRFDQLVETGTKGALMNDGVGQGLIEELAAEGPPVMRPEFQAGDALLFDDLFLHATGTDEHTTGERFAIESWFFDPSDIPEDYIGIAV